MPDDIDPHTPAVEGYCSQLSYLPGETLEVRCSTTSAAFFAEIARVGAERVVVWRSDRVRGEDQPVGPDAYANGCGWATSFTVPVSADWPSGFYEITLTADGDDRRPPGYAAFVVRVTSPADSGILLALSTNTYNAYNRWGGECLYTTATRVSFDRPLERGYIVKPVDPDGYDGRFAATTPDGDPEHDRLYAYLQEHRLSMWTTSSGWWNWERRFARWVESRGYRIDYAVNSDLDFHPEVLDGYRLMVSVGHDEYWSAGQRDTIDGFLDGGGNLAFFGGNTSVWQVRWDDGGRTMVCYRARARREDPVCGTADESSLSGAWSDPLVGRPENRTTGLTFWRGGYVRIGQAVPRSSGAFTVYQPDHWAFAGTGLRYGDLLGGGSYPVGYECDGCAFNFVDGVPVASGEDGAPEGLVVLGTSPARLISIGPGVCEAPARMWASVEPPGDLEFAAHLVFGKASPENVARLAHNHAAMAAFTRGGTVFNAGSADWAYALDGDRLVQQVTANVLDRLSAGA